MAAPRTRTNQENFEQLVSAVAAGNCVAFLGAGFLGPMPGPYRSWTELLQHAVKECLHDGATLTRSSIAASALREHLLRILDTPPETRKFLAVAQELEDAVGEAELEAALQRILQMPGPDERAGAAWWPAMKRRIALIRAIPFRAVLTTNFTEVFAGGRELTDPELSLVDALRGREPVEAGDGDRFSNPVDADMGAQANYREIALLQCILAPESPASELPPASPSDPSVLHVHGIATPVLSQQGYRRLLYRTAAYRPFLQTLLATSTVFYFGFSFSDDYLGELQSQVLAMMVPRGVRAPLLGIGVLADQTPAAVEAKRRHEGLGLMTFDSRAPPGFAFCDAVLEALFERTSEAFQLGRLLAGARITFYVRLPNGGGHYREFAVAERLCRLAWSVVPPETHDREAFEAALAEARETHARFVDTPYRFRNARHPVQTLPLPARVVVFADRQRGRRTAGGRAAAAAAAVAAARLAGVPGAVATGSVVEYPSAGVAEASAEAGAATSTAGRPEPALMPSVAGADDHASPHAHTIHAELASSAEFAQTQRQLFVGLDDASAPPPASISSAWTVRQAQRSLSRAAASPTVASAVPASAASPPPLLSPATRNPSLGSRRERLGPPGCIQICYTRESLYEQVPLLRRSGRIQASASAAAGGLMTPRESVAASGSTSLVGGGSHLSEADRPIDVLVSQFGDLGFGRPPDIASLMDVVHALPYEVRFPVVVFGIKTKTTRASVTSDYGAAAYECAYSGLVSLLMKVLAAQDQRRARREGGLSDCHITLSGLDWPV